MYYPIVAFDLRLVYLCPLFDKLKLGFKKELDFLQYAFYYNTHLSYCNFNLLNKASPLYLY